MRLEFFQRVLFPSPHSPPYKFWRFLNAYKFAHKTCQWSISLLTGASPASCRQHTSVAAFSGLQSAMEALPEAVLDLEKASELIADPSTAHLWVQMQRPKCKKNPRPGGCAGAFCRWTVCKNVRRAKGWAGEQETRHKKTEQKATHNTNTRTPETGEEDTVSVY